ncbi:DUF7286 family protein [Haloarcula marina]|uniref:DUF7286 family protein n=1 Tax=Haloarcula marina TaxID=2961574 RepID=UPI0020B67D1B|nr:hypothetical protein [Halomicroarcula marina]
MRDDTRGRVPFSLLGVLLLVSSLTLAPTLVPDPAPTETTVERVVDRTAAATQTAMRGGVATAGRRAASNPVLTTANTSVGRALNESQPFRDALRLRIYLRVRDRLAQVSATSDSVTATATLPSVETTAEYREAIERVTVASAGPNGTRLRATVENVTVTVRRDARVVTRRHVSPTVVVESPVLLLHQQVQRYDRRVNNGLAKPGLSQRLTARLYPIAWARGGAQFGGAPIDNVVANRHVSLATNGALLGVQRSTFGRSDPDGRRTLTDATAVVGIEDVVGGSRDTEFAQSLLAETSYHPPEQSISTAPPPGSHPQPNESMRVAVNGTADDAFRAVAAPDALDATLADAYTVQTRLVANGYRIGGGRPSRPTRPGENWTLLTERRTSDATVVDDATARPDVPRDWHELDSFGRVVAVEHTRVAVWENGSDETTTESARTERRRVSVALVGRHEDDTPAPDRRIRTAHEQDGSPVDGPNLADIEPRAERELLDRAGGRDAVAERAAVGRLRTNTIHVTGEHPNELRTWVYRDLRDLREEVRETNVTVERGAVGSFDANPAGQLRDRLAERRATLVDAPTRYDSTAQKARVAARIAYLDAVTDRLAAGERHHAGASERVGRVLANRTGGSLADLRRSLTARETRIPRSRPAPVSPAGPVTTRVDTGPQYLTLGRVNESAHPSLEGSETPLVARNVNLFTVPYDNAAAAVTDEGTGQVDRVRLLTAAATLRAANVTRNTSNETLARQRTTLRRRVERANAYVLEQMATTVHEETSAGPQRSREIVETATARWNGTGVRGRALANGSAAERVARVTAERRGLSLVERDWLWIRLDGATEDALSRPIARPRTPVVNQTATAVRRISRAQTRQLLADAGREQTERLVEKRLGTKTLPAGLPILPSFVPGAYWAITMNVWWVTVEGEYARFAVTANRGTPATPSASTTYVRDGDPVRLDVDGDGTREGLGTSDRLSFRAEAGIVVVVPPRLRGVGDKDGVAVETSAGWPDAGAPGE